MIKVTKNKTDKKLSKILVNDSHEVIYWLSKKGLKFVPIKGKQSFSTQVSKNEKVLNVKRTGSTYCGN